MRTLFFILLTFCWAISAGSQSDPVLFTVNKTPVTVSEFTYIYSKTNGARANYSKSSLEEYLELYKNFKLKVQKAKEMQLDTIPALKEELEGYRRQLADSYLIDKEVTEKLAEEAYQHSLQDVEISHILVRLPELEDTTRAFLKITQARSMLEMGEPFDSVAINFSEDTQVRNNYGYVGFVTAPFPQGLYPLEKLAYSGPEGRLLGPVRTSRGYHLMIVHSRRPARGEVECAHILIRKPLETGVARDAKGTIDSVYQAIKAGANFEELAKAISEDKMTAIKGGYVGVFGVSQVAKTFEDAAFGLKNEGDFSQPFETDLGWHVVKLISKRPIGTYATAKPGLISKIKTDSRFEEAKIAMIERIKKENDFREFNTTLKNFTDTLTEEFLTFRWKAPQPRSQALLFAFGAKQATTLGEFTEYLERASRKRIRMASQTSIPNVVRSLYEDFIAEQALRFEEQQLEVKYPEFKSLMREYEEGILLFEATKLLVWDKAAQDSLGLEAFFKTIEGKYQWLERAELSVYSISSLEKEMFERVQKFASKNTPEETLKRFNTPPAPILIRGERMVEKDRSKLTEKMAWQAGAVSAKAEINEKEQTQSFVKIERILPPMNKTLEEARGYVIADYQEYLEKQWVEQLKKEYPIKVNEAVFRSLLK